MYRFLTPSARSVVVAASVPGLSFLCFITPSSAEAAVVLGSVLSVPFPAPLPPVKILTILIGLHLIGLCFGLGGATMLDFWILRWMRWGGLPVEIARTFLFVSKVVSVGIALLWISGLGFLLIYAIESPEKLANPKIWAKVAIVLALTANGLLIHALVLPRVLVDVSRPMFEGVSHWTTIVFLISGAVSGVSWYAAFALGVMRELNGRVSSTFLLSLWLAGTIAASLAAFGFWKYLLARSARRLMDPPAMGHDPVDVGMRVNATPHPMRVPLVSASRIPAHQIVLIGRH